MRSKDRVKDYLERNPLAINGAEKELLSLFGRIAYSADWRVLGGEHYIKGVIKEGEKRPPEYGCIMTPIRRSFCLTSLPTQERERYVVEGLQRQEPYSLIATVMLNLKLERDCKKRSIHGLRLIGRREEHHRAEPRFEESYKVEVDFSLREPKKVKNRKRSWWQSKKDWEKYISSLKERERRDSITRNVSFGSEIEDLAVRQFGLDRGKDIFRDGNHVSIYIPGRERKIEVFGREALERRRDVEMNLRLLLGNLEQLER